MIAVRVTLGSGGELAAAESYGHAGAGKRGEDIVCAAVTVLLRTTLSVIASNGGSGLGSTLSVVAETAGRGTLSFRVSAYEEADIPLLRCAAAFLLEGIGSLEREYPESVSLKAEKTN